MRTRVHQPSLSVMNQGFPRGFTQCCKRLSAHAHFIAAFAQADAVLSAKGALPRVAGPSFPIGRVLRRRQATAGERRELAAG